MPCAKIALHRHTCTPMLKTIALKAIPLSAVLLIVAGMAWALKAGFSSPQGSTEEMQARSDEETVLDGWFTPERYQQSTDGAYALPATGKAASLRLRDGCRLVSYEATAAKGMGTAGRIVYYCSAD